MFFGNAGEIPRNEDVLSRVNGLLFEHFSPYASNEADILPITDRISDQCGHIMAQQTLPVIDGLLAATALTHGLTVATRNVADFKHSGVNLVDPFS